MKSLVQPSHPVTFDCTLKYSLELLLIFEITKRCFFLKEIWALFSINEKNFPYIFMYQRLTLDTRKYVIAPGLR